MFQNFQSNMIGNYTCTSTIDSRTLEITEGQFSSWSYYGFSYIVMYTQEKLIQEKLI